MQAALHVMISGSLHRQFDCKHHTCQQDLAALWVAVLKIGMSAGPRSVPQCHSYGGSRSSGYVEARASRRRFLVLSLLISVRGATADQTAKRCRALQVCLTLWYFLDGQLEPSSWYCHGLPPCILSGRCALFIKLRAAASTGTMSWDSTLWVRSLT